MLNLKSYLSSTNSKQVSQTEPYTKSQLEETVQGKSQTEIKLRQLYAAADSFYKMFVIHQGNKQAQPFLDLARTMRTLVIELGETISNSNDTQLQEELRQAQKFLMNALNDAAKKDLAIEDQAKEIERLKKLLESPAPSAE